MLDPLLTILQDDVPGLRRHRRDARRRRRRRAYPGRCAAFASANGVKARIFGLILVLLILLEPLGMYGRWVKISSSSQPSRSTRRATFKRQKSYMKTERHDEPIRAPKSSSLHFGGIKAVDGVTFAVEKGEVFTIIGPNGAGKTTIFNLMSRIYDPTAGRLLFEGQDITDVPPHRIARPRHRPHLPEHRTVRECDRAQNLLLAATRTSTTGFWSGTAVPAAVRRIENEHREAVEQVIDFLDLQQYRDSLIVNLPYGVRKVIELARALCTEPKLLLLDEPSSGLNVEETEDMAFWIQDIEDRARHHRADGRARHDAGAPRLRPRPGAELRPACWRAARRPRCRAIPTSSRAYLGA